MRPPTAQAWLLAELLATGLARRRRENADAWSWLESLPWSRAGGRRDQRVLDEVHRADVAAALDRAWPDATEALKAIQAEELPVTPAGWRSLAERLRARQVLKLPALLHHKTAAAVFAPHSKAAWTAQRKGRLGSTELTSDGVLRLRPGPDLHLRRGDHVLAAAEVAELTGELVLTERAVRAGVHLEGATTAVLTVENLGAYIDLEPPAGWTVVWLPGWNMPLVEWLLAELQHVPAVHFGDLDPEGVQIVRHLRKVRPDTHWFIPSFWAEHSATRGQPGTWPCDALVDGTPEWVRDLVARGLWLEQEALVVDERLSAELVQFLAFEAQQGAVADIPESASRQR